MWTWEWLYVIHLHNSIQVRGMWIAGVYFTSAAVVQITPLLILQKTYRRSVLLACSNLETAEPGSFGTLSRSSDSARRLWGVAIVAITLIGLIFFAIARR